VISSNPVEATALVFRVCACTPPCWHWLGWPSGSAPAERGTRPGPPRTSRGERTFVVLAADSGSGGPGAPA